MSQKVFGDDLVAMRKSKVTLILNKPAYFGFEQSIDVRISL